jgi:glucokinase
VSAAPCVVGVDVGGTKILGVVLSPENDVVAELRVATPQRRAAPGSGSGAPATGDEGDRAAVVDAIALLVRDLQRDHGSGPVGVGIPGMLDRTGTLLFSPNLPAAAAGNVAAALSERLGGAPVRVDNDADCAALAELTLGAAQGVRTALMVTLGTGIGGAVIVDGSVYRGAHGLAGEVGHMVVDPSGPPCPCGGRGCWERYASGAGLARLAREAALAGSLFGAVALAGGDPELVRGEHVARAAAGGDPGSLAVMETLGWWVALGLANLVALFDPERIIVGGGLAAVGEMLLAPVRRFFAELVEGGPLHPQVPIGPAELGERAGAVGAALGAR